jgi:autotransporter-associated beta strand protein
MIGGTVSGGELRTWGGTMTFRASASGASISSPFNLVGSATLNVADGLAPVDLTLSGAIFNTGGLAKTGLGLLRLTGASTYSGATTVSAGTLLVAGALAAGSPVTVQLGATLGGTGIIGGVVTNKTGSTLAPGDNGVGTLTLGSTPVLQGRLVLEIEKGARPNADKLVVSGKPLAYGGSLLVTNIGANALTAGDTFTLFGATSYSGSFSKTNLPPLTPGLGWVWVPGSGTLSVSATVSTEPTRISWVVNGGELTLSWPPDHTGWRLQAQTNTLALGSGSNWADVADSKTTNQVTLPLIPRIPAVFYRIVSP